MIETRKYNINEMESKKTTVKIEPRKSIDLDDIMVNEIGEFGRYQFNNLLLVSIPAMIAALSLEFIFTASSIPHRCRIPECEAGSETNILKPDWVLNAIPEKSTGLVSCERYAPVNGINGTINTCPTNLFNHLNIVPCEEYVYARDNSLVYDFDLGCKEWLRVLAGTLGSVGNLLALSFLGFISDHFGRKITLVVSIFNMALFGLLKAFSVNYTMYLTLQILQSTLGGGIYGTAFIIATELVGPKYRVMVGAVLSSVFAVGSMILGLMAWLINSWRYLIIAIHVPCFLLISFHWFLPESVRWLLSKKKYNEAFKILENMAKINNRQISTKSKEISSQSSFQESKEHQELITRIIRSPSLLRRVCTTPMWWITATFVYYGLTLNAVTLSGNMYLNYILTSAIEIPGTIFAVWIVGRIGRKITLSLGFFCSAACNIAFIFISTDLPLLQTVIYLGGKFWSSLIMTVLYLYTFELYPTEFRHSLLGFSSMFGRIGSICAPLTPVLMQYWVEMPSALFGGFAILSGLLVLTQPETLGTKLPDTLAEAEELDVLPSKQMTRL